MTVLRHAIGIAAPRAHTFKAVSDVREMAAWRSFAPELFSETRS